MNRQRRAGDVPITVGEHTQPEGQNIASKFARWQAFELERARGKNPPITSLHAAYAIILEELDEVWDEVKKKPHDRSEPLLVEELVQVAAMCQRAVEDLGLEGVYRPR